VAVDPYIQDFLKVIREFRYDNTYKLVWAKSIISLCSEGKSGQIKLSEIAEKIIPLYWNLHIHFDPEGKTLREGSNPTKPPEILQVVIAKIAEYKQLRGNQYKPVFYERLTDVDMQSLGFNYQSLAKILNQDVAHRFLKLGSSKLNLYQFVKGDESIVIDGWKAKLIADHTDILSEAIQLRWVKILEDFNTTTPRIAAKLSLSLDKGSKTRKSLSSFKQYLDIENPNRLCSECEKPIEDKDLSIDHVIPWSFIYSDNLWNLTYAHRGCNSAKSNVTPDKTKIEKLNQRNLDLCNHIEQNHSELTHNKYYKELRSSVDDNLLTKMWTLYRGY
jgi:hypothetical protein